MISSTIPTGWSKENLKKYENYIYNSLNHLYDNENNLFENNLCERCLVFRFAHHLQTTLNQDTNNEYYVDCDYNSSTYYDAEEEKWKRYNGKPIQDQTKGKIKKRFIDIIIHKREYGGMSDLICFEVKKWNNQTKEGMKKDKNNLKKLTTYYGYEFGFHLIFGKIKKDIRLETFHNGKKIKLGDIGKVSVCKRILKS